MVSCIKTTGLAVTSFAMNCTEGIALLNYTTGDMIIGYAGKRLYG